MVIGGLSDWLTAYLAVLVEADGAGSKGNHLKKSAGHHQVLVKVDQVGLVSDRQVYAEAGG